jgi:tRNA threonylcarbamoyladenosine biosynthesis protein TsaB
VFAAAYVRSAAGPVAELLAPRALAPEQVGGAMALAEEHGALAGGWLAAGDGAIRYRAQLEGAGASVPDDGSPLHRVDAETICRLGASERPVAAYEQILPDYRRRPDAEIALEAVAAEGGASA